jgi:hypothetical protein
LGPGRAHAYAFAGGKDDGQTAAGVGVHVAFSRELHEASGSQYRREANAVSTCDARRVNVSLPRRQNGVSLRRKKRYTTQNARDGTRRACDAFFSC